ncbi:hypothetical protein PENTCL1PPCAC_14682, partial [Pristionchus entomophagus]
VLSFVINALLILAVVQSSKVNQSSPSIAFAFQNLGGYRYLLFAFTINDIYFPLVHALTLPVRCTFHMRLNIISLGNMLLPPRFRHVLAWNSKVKGSMKTTHLRFYSAFNTFLLVIVSVLLQKNLWFWNCWFNYDSDEELEAYLRPYVNEEFPGEEPVHIGALYYNDKGIRLSAILATMGFNAIMSFWVAVIVVCSVMIVRLFKNSGGLTSHKNEVLQKQLFATLVAQMIVPILCVFLPCALIINAPIFAQISAFPNLVSVALTFFPVLDAFVTI